MKNYVNVKFGDDCRDKLIEGVNLVTEAVSKTYGPNGKNVIIKTQSGVKITKDGYSVAAVVNDPDKYVMMGVEIIKNICQKTAKDVGDGTSTSAILAREIVNSFSDVKDPVYLTRQLKEASKQVIDFLEQHKAVVTGREDLVKVATISANNDATIGDLVASAFEKVGKDGIVMFDESEDVMDKVEYTEGFQIDNGFASPYFVNTAKGTCELSDVLVHISDIKMDEVNEVVKLADSAVRSKRSLLLIAPEFDSEILMFLASNKEMLKSCVVISPNHKNFRRIMLEDMRILLGSSSVCKRVVITKEHTTFMGCDSDSEKVKERVEEIRATLAEGSLGEIEETFHKKRLANFTSGIATIHVGGYSKVETKERYDRVEDAVCATQAALDEGILPGGGVMLRIASELFDGKFKDFLQTLSRLFGTTSKTKEEMLFDCKFKNFLQTPSRLLGTTNKTKEEMLEMGVIEPFLVTKTVLENAVSTASLVLTADAAICFDDFNC